MSNNVSHPKHYTQGGIECIDALKAATVGKTGIEAVCVANVNIFGAMKKKMV